MEPTTSYPEHIKPTRITQAGFVDVIKGWQSFARFFFKPIYTTMCRGVETNLEANDIRPYRSYVVASNHQSQLDSFILLAGFSNQMFALLRPFRAMTMNRYLMGGIVSYAAIRMGCYPAKRHPSLPSGVDAASGLLGVGQTVYICPEGDLSLPGERAARPGIAVLAKIPNVEIIPAHIQWVRHGRIRRTFKLTYGKPFDGSAMSAQEILDACYALPLR